MLMYSVMYVRLSDVNKGHFINWCAKCVFSFSQDCFLLSGSLALEAILIGVHCKKRYINVQIQYSTIQYNNVLLHVFSIQGYSRAYMYHIGISVAHLLNDRAAACSTPCNNPVQLVCKHNNAFVTKKMLLV